MDGSAPCGRAPCQAEAAAGAAEVDPGEPDVLGAALDEDVLEDDAPDDDVLDDDVPAVDVLDDVDEDPVPRDLASLR